MPPVLCERATPSFDQYRYHRRRRRTTHDDLRLRDRRRFARFADLGRLIYYPFALINFTRDAVHNRPRVHRRSANAAIASHLLFNFPSHRR